MPLDPHQPVLVGVAQAQRKPSSDVDLASLTPPIAWMTEVARAAGEDSGTGDALLRRAESVRMIESLSFRATNPAAEVAAAIGASPWETVVSHTGGDSPQMVLNDAAEAIQAGDADVILIVGVEVMYSRNIARKRGERLTWPDETPGTAAPTRMMGDSRPGTTPFEMSRQLLMPTSIYPIFECALRAAAGESVEEHTARIAELWSRFSAVAAKNPHAWSPVEQTAAEIATPGPDNRMIGFPYPKVMNANIQVDQAAALLLCSVEAAQDAGVPEDRWVFPWAGADGADHWFVSERDRLDRSEAIAACGRAAMESAGVGMDDVGYIDIYSCFPAAVQLGAQALGIDAWDPTRVPTVTGGLTFAGGPGNNYVTHSIATMAETLRSDPGALGMVTALGWYATKHSVGLYSTAPPPSVFRASWVQDEVDDLPSRGVAEEDAEVTVEAYTVTHERDGSPANAIVAGVLADGRRTWANSTDADLLGRMVGTEDFVGRAASVRAGVLHVA